MERRLAAILAADVVGYSRLVRADEEGTLRTLSTYREVIDGLVAAHRGRIFGSAGDSVIAEFASPVEAVRCAAEVQQELGKRNADVPEDRRMEFRIGVNLGDVVVKGDDLLGDGVNVAARLQELADPGGIYVSDDIHRHVEGKIDVSFADLGDQSLKNIATPVRVHRVQMRDAGLGGASAASEGPQLPDKPSIAVLPFVNISGDPKQEYFVDGITENIITELSRFRDLFVIASHSVFTYKGKEVKVQQVARELGVQYVLEGSVQREGDRLRITAQLVDATTGGHVWAERYDRKVTDFFAVQEEVTQEIVAVLGGWHGSLSRAVREGARRKGTADLQANECVLLGYQHKHRFTKEENAIARQLVEKAIELDPEYSRAHALLAWVDFYDWWFGWSESPAECSHRALENAKMAVALDPSEADAHMVLGAVSIGLRRFEQGIAAYGKAIALNPNDADIFANWGRRLSYLGRAEEAIEVIQKAIRLNPYYPDWYDWNLGIGYYTARRYEQAIAPLVRIQSHSVDTRCYLAASYAQLGRGEEARAEADEVLKIDPEFSTAHWAQMQPYKNQADRDHYLDGMRKAGLPE